MAGVKKRRAALAVSIWILGGLAAASGFRYFNDGYDVLQMKACTLQAHGTLASFNSSDAAIKAGADAKTSILDTFYSMASSYGKDDVAGATTTLRNEARLNWNIKQFKKPVALEALYCSEASVKFFLNKDKTVADPKRPPLAAGYESTVLRLVGQAESAFAAGKYAQMRKLFYHALWTAYPVTSKAPYADPKD